MAEESKRSPAEGKADTLSRKQRIARILQDMADTGAHSGRYLRNSALEFLLYTQGALRPRPSSDSRGDSLLPFRPITRREFLKLWESLLTSYPPSELEMPQSEAVG